MTPIVGGNTIKITGKLVLRFKNDTTGKTIEENVSGPDDDDHQS